MFRKAKKAHGVALQFINDTFGSDFQEFVKKRALTDVNNNESNDRRHYIDELCKIEKNGQGLTFEEVAENIKTILIAVSPYWLING